MIAPPKDRLEQLDIPLVWELDGPPRARRSADDPFHTPTNDAGPSSTGRIWVAALADIGAMLLALAAAWGVAAAAGAELAPPQLLIAALAGIEAGTLAGAACVWAWRATPGMLLLHVAFVEPLAPRRALRLWFAWLLALALLGLPVLVGRRGRRVVERIGGAEISLRSHPAAA